MRLYGRIGQSLLEAKQSGTDPFAAIEAVMPWDTFAANVTEAQKLAQPEGFDFLHRIGESYATLRRYAPELLDVLKLRAAPAAGLYQHVRQRAARATVCKTPSATLCQSGWSPC